MPIFDFKCPHCKQDATLLMTIPAYEEWTEGECEKCQGKLTKKDRDIGRGITKKVIGVSKGNHNSRDWS